MAGTPRVHRSPPRPGAPSRAHVQLGCSSPPPARSFVCSRHFQANVTPARSRRHRGHPRAHPAAPGPPWGGDPGTAAPPPPSVSQPRGCGRTGRSGLRTVRGCTSTDAAPRTPFLAPPGAPPSPPGGDSSPVPSATVPRVPPGAGAGRDPPRWARTPHAEQLHCGLRGGRGAEPRGRGGCRGGTRVCGPAWAWGGGGSARLGAGRTAPSPCPASRHPAARRCPGAPQPGGGGGSGCSVHRARQGTALHGTAAGGEDPP